VKRNEEVESVRQKSPIDYSLHYLNQSKWIILYVVIIIVYFKLRRPEFAEALLLIIVGSVTLDYVQNGRLSFKNIILTGILFSVFYWVIIWFGGYGIWGGVAVLLLIIGLRLWTGRKQLIEACRVIETQLFGKS